VFPNLGIARRIVTDRVDAFSFRDGIVGIVRCGRHDVYVLEVVCRLDLRNEVREGDTRVIVDRLRRALSWLYLMPFNGPPDTGGRGDNTSLRDNVVLPFLQFGEDRSVEITLVKTGIAQGDDKLASELLGEGREVDTPREVGRGVMTRLRTVETAVQVQDFGRVKDKRGEVATGRVGVVGWVGWED
jgi:hypothetical protein